MFVRLVVLDYTIETGSFDVRQCRQLEVSIAAQRQ